MIKALSDQYPFVFFKFLKKIDIPLPLLDEQRRIALDTIADVEASGLWPGKVVTEVEPAGDFWEAEPEHQDYLLRYPNGYTCHFVRPGWRLPKRAKAAAE